MSKQRSRPKPPATGIRERRYTAAPGTAAGAPALELRKHSSGTTISGYAVVYGSVATVTEGFREVFRAGAFARALREKQDCRGLVNHNVDKIIGRTAAGTMRLREDARGLHYEIDTPPTGAGRDVVQSIARGDISGSSFCFTVPNDNCHRITYSDHGGDMLREVLDADLHDCAPVVYPCYSASSVAVQDGGQASADPGDIRQRLRKVQQDIEADRRRPGNLARRRRLKQALATVKGGPHG